MEMKHKEALKRAEAMIIANHGRVEATKWRPVYHVSAPVGWINDPNGFCYYNGQYHLFYQYHPYSAKWGPMHWGHVVSSDLVHWERLPVALAPGEPYDKDGCFSGSAIDKDGKLYLLYTGHVDLPTNRKGDIDRIESQCIAVSNDGIHFEKHSLNPVISRTPEGDIHPGHFRDPKIWQHNGMYYCVVGSQTKDEQGQVLLFRSEDLISWQFVNVMAKSSGELGFMWECPSFEYVDNVEVLVFSPQGVVPQGNNFLNLHQSGYFIGELNYETGLFSHGDFGLLDYGFDFYAPQTMTDPSGRPLMIAWMDMWESEMPEQADDWACMMTLPRRLEHKNGKIFTPPIEEVALLRGNQIRVADVVVEEKCTLSGVEGDSYELELTVNLSQATKFEIALRVSELEATMLIYDKEQGILILNRERAGQGPKGERQVPVALQGESIILHIFVDRSSIEVFVNNGETVLSARIYPNQDATGVTFAADGRAFIEKAIFYEIKANAQLQSASA